MDILVLTFVSVLLISSRVLYGLWKAKVERGDREERRSIWTRWI